MAKIAVVRIRGPLRKTPIVRSTFEKLKLFKKYNCIIIEDTPSNKGAVETVRNFVTWGEVSDEIIKKLENRKKRACYTLHPPRGGFERKGTKVSFKAGGALGYRGEKINILLERMA